MRVLIAPDKFAGTLTAVEAAEAIATGLGAGTRPTTSSTWRRWPTAVRGSSTCCTRRSAASCSAVTVEAPHGERVPATVLFVEDVAYVETAQAVGLHLIDGRRRVRQQQRRRRADPRRRSRAARRTVVVGLGGSGTNDGGAGVLAALGATSDGILDSGAIALDTVTTRRPRAGPRAAGRASRWWPPPTSTTRSPASSAPPRPSARRRGSPRSGSLEIDGWLEAFAAVTDRRTSLEKGAGAAGGIGFALLVLGARREPGHRAGRRARPARASGPARPTW